MLCLANSPHELNSRDYSWQTERVRTASDWFSRRFPVQVSVFGSPFLEKRTADVCFATSSTPIIPNIDCLAACLGGDERLGHRVIYHSGELQFYFYDPRTQSYHATTTEKLANLLRGLLARCAGEVGGDGHVFNVFATFRADQVVKAVVHRCKSLLAADPDFFGVNSPHQRVAGPELHQRLARVFAEQMLEVNEGSLLTIGQTFGLFNQFAKARNMPAMKRSLFKSMMAEVIRETYDLGVRNDLMNPETQTQQCGWRGLRPVTTSEVNA